MTTISHLECTICSKTYDHTEKNTLCRCGGVLFAKYDLEKAKETLTKDTRSRPYNIWRMEEIMPCSKEFQFTLGEGWSPILKIKTNSTNIYIKDEGVNPTGTFKARGLGAAVSKAVENGTNNFAIPTAGNAGAALSAYCALTNSTANVFMPQDAPKMIQNEVKAYSGNLHLVNGTIADAAKLVKEKQLENDWFDVSTLKEPYRLEGKATMGLEIAEQFNWTVPDVLIYPTGGGTGIIGILKAFDELETIGLIGEKRPRMVVVQTDGCAPVVKAIKEGKKESEFWNDAKTLAPGLRVPKAVGDYLIIDAVKRTNGTAISVSDNAIIEAMKQFAKNQGMMLSPEAAATISAYDLLKEADWIGTDEEVLCISTANGMTTPNLWNKILSD